MVVMVVGPLDAWRYLVREGAVSGGDYDSNEGCHPYKLNKPCSHHVTSKKLATCSAKRDSTPKSASAYKVYPCAAENEIYKNGTIVAAFAVYEDFYTYKSGVYKYETGKLVGYHAARVIGWGVEKETPYWTVVIFWNAEWGDKGFIKILRGDNEVLIEEYFTAGEVETSASI